MSHALQKAKIDGQLLELTIDLGEMPDWKRKIMEDMVAIINSPDATEDERTLSRNTLAEVFVLYERGSGKSREEM